MNIPEQQAEEILVREGFAQPEEMEPEIAELLRKASRRVWITIDGGVSWYVQSDEEPDG